MSQSPSTSASLSTRLIDELRPICLAATGQERVGHRLLAVTMGLILVSGRTMLTRVLLALGLGWRDWSATYRLFRQARVDLAVLRRAALTRWLRQYPADGPLLVVLDGTQLPRTSRTMPGVGFLRAPRTPAWRPGIHYAQRWEGLSGLTPLRAEGDTRAIPLWFEPAPTPKASPWAGIAPRPEWAAGLAALGWLRTELAQQAAARREIVVLADGAYTGAEMWNGVPDHTTLLARCAKNRALFALPPAPTPGRGRRRLYGDRAPTPQEQRAAPGGWQTVTCQVRGQERQLRTKLTGPWVVRKASAHPVFLITVAGISRQRGSRRIQRDPTYYLVSARQAATGIWDLPYALQELVRWAWQRWEVEVMHRELKSGWGLGDQQQWHPVSAALVPQWVVWASAMALLLAGDTPPVVPATKWYRGRRWTPRDVLTEVRQDLWHQSLPEFLLPAGGCPTTRVENAAQPPPPLAWLRIAHAISRLNALSCSLPTTFADDVHHAARCKVPNLRNWPLWPVSADTCAWWARRLATSPCLTITYHPGPERGASVREPCRPSPRRPVRARPAAAKRHLASPLAA